MVEIKTVKKGAELVSINFNGFEKLHDGKEFWNRHSPVLFPIVGRLKDDKMIYKGEEYHMSQHGFARDMEFEEIGENSYLLKSNKETKEKFPFDFELYISYEVEGNTIKTKYKVVNKSEEDMIFGLGAHPAFVCDYSSGHFKIEFEDEEDEIEVYQLEDGLVKDNPEKLTRFLKENRLFLEKDTFNNDAIIFSGIKSRKLYLKTETKTILELNFKDFPYLGVWSKPGAPFVCLEPWFNTADKVSSNGNFEEKENLIELKPGEEFKAEYSVKFYE